MALLVLDLACESNTPGCESGRKELLRNIVRGFWLLLDAIEVAVRKNYSSLSKVSSSMPSISPDSIPDSTVSLKDLRRRSVFVKDINKSSS